MTTGLPCAIPQSPVPSMRLPRLCVLLLLSACREPSAPAKAPPAPVAQPLPHGQSPLPQKLGLQFLPMEEEDGGLQWLASSPIRCSAGEHDLVRCLTITPLASDGRLQPDGGIASVGVVAADADTAHRLCAQRFGGRLPTPAQRARLGALHGLSSLLVVQTSSPAERFRYLELPEWTEEGSCDNPVRPGEGCAVTLFPSDSAAEAMRAGELSCTARRVVDSSGYSVIDLGEACPRELGLAMDAGVQTLPCLLRVRGPTAADPAVLYALSCSAFEAVRPAADLEVRAGAYRCLVPPTAFGQAPTAR